MDDFERNLQDQITELAESADPSGAQRVLHRLQNDTTGTGQRPRRIRRVLVLGATGLVAAAATVFALNATGVIGTGNARAPVASRATGGQPGSVTSSNADVHNPKNFNSAHTWGLGEHCFGVKSTPVSKLASIVKTPIWLPGNDTSRVTDSWNCGGGPFGVPEVMVGEVQISYETGWGNVDVPTKWRALVNDDGGYTTTIAGHEALVQPANAPPDSIFNYDGMPVSTKGSTRNSIMIVHNGTLVRLLSKADVPMSHLLNDAKALNFNQPVTAH